MLQAVRLLTEMARTSDDRSRSGEASTLDVQASSSTNEASNPPVLFREIHKNGWLRRTDCKPDKEQSARCWVAFCVHDDAEPRLEGFADQRQATAHSPLWSQSLRGVQHLSPTLCATPKNDYEFCVSLADDRALRLAAPTYQAMLDWVQVVTRKLTEMKVLGPKENLYSRPPERSATRDPTSPLPPPPPPPPPLLNLNTSNSRPAASSSSSTIPSVPTVFTFENVGPEERRPSLQRQPTRSAPPVPPSPQMVSGGSSSISSSSSNSSSSSSSSSNSSNHSSVSSSSSSNAQGAGPAVSNTGDSSYESVFLASSVYPQTSDSSRQANNVSAGRAPSSSEENDQYAALIECRSPESANRGSNANLSLLGTATAALGSNTNPGGAATLAVAPASSQARQVRPQLTLREQQVLQLRKEMSHPAGVRMKLGRRDCKDGIAFVDCFGAVWIAGWKHKEHPLLYNVLHIGDLVLSIAGVPLNGASSIKDIIKNYTLPRVEMIVRRLPHGRVTTLTRRIESEDFGLEVGTSNEVVSVSTAAQALGLSVMANPADPGAEIGTTVGWTLTEVNNRPLNLFEGSARERIGAALGRDLSVVLQPSDLVSAIKKKLRAVRNYKSFVLQ